MKLVIIFVISLALLLAAASLAAVQPTYAQKLDKDDGASYFAPGQEAKIPVPQPPIPHYAKDYAPGQEAKISPAPCGNCAKDFAPGQEALKDGIIGPDIKG